MLYFEQNFNTIALICTVQWRQTDRLASKLTTLQTH